MCVNPLAIAGGFFCLPWLANYNYIFVQINYIQQSHDYVIGFIIKKTIFTTKKITGSSYTFFLPLICQ